MGAPRDRGRAARALLVQDDDRFAGLPVGAEVAALRHPAAVDGSEARLEGAGVEAAEDIPIAGGHEAHALPLALDHESRGDRLHSACRQAARHLLPEHRRDLVAVEAVEDAPGLLRVDEVAVDLARLLERAQDCLLRDLVEDHAPYRHLRLQRLDEMVRDRLALAVLVGCEQQLVGVLQLPPQLGDDLLLVGIDHVVRLEPLVDGHA